MGLNTHLCKFGCDDLRFLFLSLKNKHSQEHGINHGTRLGKIVILPGLHRTEVDSAPVDVTYFKLEFSSQEPGLGCLPDYTY